MVKVIPAAAAGHEERLKRNTTVLEPRVVPWMEGGRMFNGRSQW